MSAVLGAGRLRKMRAQLAEPVRYDMVLMAPGERNGL